MKLRTVNDLKTVNDFEGLDHDNPILDVEDYVLPDELKQEAIKRIKTMGKFCSPSKEWPKKFLKKMKKNEAIADKLFITHMEFHSAIAVLMELFDITEEDLKC